MVRNGLKIGAIVTLLFAALIILWSPAPIVQAQVQYELQCPGGSQPLMGVGTTYNASTGKFRQWLCQDNNGNITQSTGAGSPAAPTNSVQFNNAGALGGSANFVYVQGTGLTITDPNHGNNNNLIVNSSGVFIGYIGGAQVLGAINGITGGTFANLPTSPSNGMLYGCSDCTTGSNPCTGASTGALAVRQNGVWVCK